MASPSSTLATPSVLRLGQEARIQRSSSRETLEAHPLLSPGPTGASSPPVSNTSPESKGVQAPKYLPYTPRQRVPSGAVTTGTTVSSPVSAAPQQLPGNATHKLQLQNLKAAAQAIGLDAGSIGWLILEELVTGIHHEPAWIEIWNAITTGKVRSNRSHLFHSLHHIPGVCRRHYFCRWNMQTPMKPSPPSS